MAELKLIPEKKSYSINEIIENTKRIYNYNYISTSDDGKKIHTRIRKKLIHDLRFAEKISIPPRRIEYYYDDVIKLFTPELNSYFEKLKLELIPNNTFYYTISVENLPETIEEYKELKIEDKLDSRLTLEDLEQYKKIIKLSSPKESLNQSLFYNLDNIKIPTDNLDNIIITSYALYELLEENELASNPYKIPDELKKIEKYLFRKKELKRILNL
ncbi:hypothetical protein [Peptostreptococcus faecalis]|uniref:hypothetical protein n=1 Tax=Peptostreptococcus faecalis TaxID=2045015 RepID=UPI000C7A264E|nr:hypothetical protein [Peptostreptococcus faecalis]